MKADPKRVLLQDGTYADPKDVSKSKDGTFRHKSGLAVATYDDGEPFTLADAAALNTAAAGKTDNSEG